MGGGVFKYSFISPMPEAPCNDDEKFKTIGALL